MTKSSLIDQALKQIVEDVKNQDLTAIEELLMFVPKENLIEYLSEEDQSKISL